MSTRVSIPVTQRDHGFVRGTPVLFDGDDWVFATTGASGVGVVGSVLSSDAFELVMIGDVLELDGLTPGSLYYPDGSGGLSTEANGSSIGQAISDRVLFVNASGPSTSGTTSPSYVTADALAIALAAEVARAEAAYEKIVTARASYLHSVQYDGVISIDPARPGPVFDISDGTQILTA